VSFTTERRIEFRDTDAAGIVHFSAFVPLMESAEHEMLRSLGLSVLPKRREGDEHSSLTWPRVAASCNYIEAVRFEDLVQIAVTVAKIGVSSVCYRFDFTRGGTKLAEGSMTAVCCRLSSVGLDKAEIPDSIRQLLARYE
jgi:4-hydroxybenzoyl-CoA thioesterase/acyl-CoA thioester hydrolase